ncbi:MAG: GNAT family N-acetyltransferase [Nitrosotalea sp.]
MSKITSIDFDTEVEVYRLEKGLFDINNFKCSNSVYEEYIKKEAHDDQKTSIAQTWLFVYKNQNVIGYVSIAMGDLNKTQHEKLKGFPHTNVPGLLLGRIATHKDYENLKVGRKMVDWVFSEAIRYTADIGCRILYLNPEQGVEGWYTKMGFAQIKKRNSNIMFFDLELYKNSIET